MMHAPLDPQLAGVKGHNNADLARAFTYSVSMPKVRRSRRRPPEGWELIEPTLDELDQKMREGKEIAVK